MCSRILWGEIACNSVGGRQASSQIQQEQKHGGVSEDTLSGLHCRGLHQCASLICISKYKPSKDLISLMRKNQMVMKYQILFFLLIIWCLCLVGVLSKSSIYLLGNPTLSQKYEGMWHIWGKTNNVAQQHQRARN